MGFLILSINMTLLGYVNIRFIMMYGEGYRNMNSNS